MPFPLPKNTAPIPEELALQSALGGDVAPDEEADAAEGPGDPMQIMQLVNQIKAAGNPEISRLLDQLLGLLGLG